MTTLTMRTRGDREFTALGRRFEQAAAELSYRLSGALQEEGQQALAEVRAAWLGVEVQSSRGGGGSTGLRARVAAATVAKPHPGGVTIEVESGRVGDYGRTLVYGLNGMGRWRHPVFGNDLVWAQQYGQEVFYRTLRGRGWESRLQRVVDDVAREIRG